MSTDRCECDDSLALRDKLKASLRKREALVDMAKYQRNEKVRLRGLLAKIEAEHAYLVGMASAEDLRVMRQELARENGA